MNNERLEAILASEKLDAVVGTTPENVTYLSGFWSMTQWIRRGPQAYAFHPSGGRDEPCIIANTGTLDLIADQQPWVKKVRRYGYFAMERADDVSLSPLDQRQWDLFQGPDFGGPVEALVDAIKSAGLEKGNIGIDELGISPQCMAQMREALPDLKITNAFEVFRQVRAIKTPEEVENLRRACNIAEASIDASLAAARVGMSEVEMARIFHTTTVQNDALPVLGCIGFGGRSALINAQPSEMKLKDGDVIRFDVGGRYRHYRADISRIATMGEPTNKVKDVYEALRAGVEHAYEIIEVGLPANELFERVMYAVHKAGLKHYKRSHVGHGIGVDGYDVPSLSPNNKEKLQAGMVICVETPYYELGFAGLQVEDMIHITESGAVSLMSDDRALRII